MACRVPLVPLLFALAVPAPAACGPGPDEAATMQDDTMSARDGALPDTGEREVWTPEPDTFDPAVACPGGCGHLDAPCARGECTLTGCVAAATVNRACDDGDPCTRWDKCHGDASCSGTAGCYDGDPTTDDLCGPDGCEHPKLASERDLENDPEHCGAEHQICPGGADALCVGGHCARCVAEATFGPAGGVICPSMPAGVVRACFSGTMRSVPAHLAAYLRWDVGDDVKSECVVTPDCAPPGERYCGAPPGCRYVFDGGQGDAWAPVRGEILLWEPGTVTPHLYTSYADDSGFETTMTGRLVVESPAAGGTSCDEP